MSGPSGLPLAGITVLDFSTLLPGPMATLLLAEAGADVLKIERPERGEDMRHYPYKLGAASVNFALLNRGKCSIAIDLKAPDAVARLTPLIRRADVVVEQFRPGVMDRLGLGYDALRALNPRLVYCAITGYGQTGPRADVAAHDLNYIGDTGLLALSADADGAPIVPPALIADIGGGALPAVINILLALRRRDVTGQGCKLDVAMCDSLFAFEYWALGQGEAEGAWPRPGGELVSGGSPRYQIYRTKDGRFVAAAPLEPKFWTNFCALIDLAPEWRDDARDPSGTMRAVASRIAAESADFWRGRFTGQDCCCTIVQTIEEARRDPHFVARRLFERRVVDGDRQVTALPLPIDPQLVRPEVALGYPALGDGNHLLDRA
jgi:crotonobetainyl-CoA:carnitine CoA-transferase CaiB-like acyl-CoA transferase